MNERIKEFAEQANIRFSRTGILDGDPNGTARFVGYSKMEKFAELLVRECVSTLETRIDEGEGYGSYENGSYHGLIRARNIIKKHFGVD